MSNPNNAALAPTGTLVAASSYGYDPFGRLTSINASLGSGNFINQSWGYDTLNRMANYTNQWEGTTGYGYDNDNRLISAANRRHWASTID